MRKKKKWRKKGGRGQIGLKEEIKEKEEKRCSRNRVKKRNIKHNLPEK